MFLTKQTYNTNCSNDTFFWGRVGLMKFEALTLKHNDSSWSYLQQRYSRCPSMAQLSPKLRQSPVDFEHRTEQVRPGEVQLFDDVFAPGFSIKTRDCEAKVLFMITNSKTIFFFFFGLDFQKLHHLLIARVSPLPNSIPKRFSFFFQMLQSADEFDTTTSFHPPMPTPLKQGLIKGTPVVKNPLIRPYFLGCHWWGTPIASQLRTHDHQDQQQQNSCPSNRFGSRKKAIEPQKHRSQLVSLQSCCCFCCCGGNE